MEKDTILSIVTSPVLIFFTHLTDSNTQGLLLVGMRSMKVIFTAIALYLCVETKKILGLEDWTGWSCENLIADKCKLDVEEGEVDVRGIKVHYWKYSRNTTLPPSAETLSLSPIIFIHGGPSLPHNYGLPLKKQACRGRDIIFYDQAGCGKSLISDAPVDDESISLQYPWLLDINYYAIEELQALISYLGYKSFHVIGHSFGSMIAQVFALDGRNKYVKGLQSLTLSGPISDASLFAQAQWDPKDGSITKLPFYLQERIRALQGTRQFDSEEYEAIVNTYWYSYMAKTQPLPDCVAASFDDVNTNIYRGLFGKDEFSIGGTIKDFDITSRIHKIKIPVLLTTGEYDNVRPQVVDVIQQELKYVEREVFANSAHLSMIDVPDKMNQVVQDFLDRVERATAKNKKFKPKKSAYLLTNDISYGEETSRSGYSNAALSISMLMAFIVGIYGGVRATWVNQQDMYQPIVQTAY